MESKNPLTNLHKYAKYHDSPVTQLKESTKKTEIAVDQTADCLSNMQAKLYYIGRRLCFGHVELPKISWPSGTCEGTLASCMKRGNLFWRWPVCNDEQIYSWGNIICKTDVRKFEKRCFSVPELDD